MNEYLEGDQIPTRGNAFSRWLGHTVLSLLGWKITGVIPNRSKLIIAVAPHTSNWDFVVCVASMLAMGIQLNFLGKHTIFIGPFKRILEWLGGIAVERSAHHGVVDQLAEQFATREQMILALAPEGTRKKAFRWKTGFISIASKANVPVMLAGLDYKEKEVQLGPLYEICEEPEVELKKIQSWFSQVTAKYPNNT
ncbi:1-acyl-sn-glycerol-3-phosphate acyltransferase [Algicola sagamiensis]|uniref:1-acyl-sn-glycerol-3-phosphate acyltransferase n=1 Tax=Algicola sagamiensis TaxID=163869 RepID=UPI000374C387|nr:1-acyl-sn-glycerol-3-phosphate acyltransferase [Algicola sagamiensis]